MSSSNSPRSEASLVPGTKLGPYEIVGPLGAGGMGEVYCARDTRLQRTVAIKILPSHMSSHPVLKQRFELEAKAISGLNHPHICVLYDIGHQDGMDYLVMEHAEGETLARCLEEGPLSLDQVLTLGMQVADALDKAHQNGIVHRDVKPSNIVLTQSGAKLLDFGLAKPIVGLATISTLSDALALPSPITKDGAIVGTFQYMSPEQVRGNELDGRSDIFSLGSVLYEALTGQVAFRGSTQLSVVSAILGGEPEPINAIKPLTPRALVEAIHRCLARDRDQRWQNARDLALELKWIADAGYQVTQPTPVPQKSSKSRWIGSFLAAGLFLLLMVTGADLWYRHAELARPMYFHASVPFAANDLAVSPDGRSVAVVAYSSQLENVVVWKYEVGGLHKTYLEATEGASFPFWSPDGRSLGFFADGKLKKLDLASGQAEVLCDAPNGRGGSWNRDGVIIFTPDGFGGLFRVPSSGGSPVEISKPDSSRFETSHRWPVFLPDGKHFLYLAANFTEEFQNSAIFIGSLDSREKRFVVNTTANAVYAEPGYLLYMHDKILVAQSFDLHSYALKDEPHALDGGVLYFPQVYRASFSTSNGDVLVTQTTKNASLSQLAWFDRTGNPAGTVDGPAYYDNVRLSSDSSRIATDQTDPGGRNVDIWIHDPARGVATRITFNASAHQSPIWSPDNRQILFASNRKLGFNLYLKNADGSGSEQELADFHANVSANAWDWSQDGKYILVRKANELWYMSRTEMSVRPLLTAKWTIRNAQFSPDGRWIAYTSNENGRMEVYVSPFPSINSKWQISTVGGQEPRWRQDGRELFYVSPNGTMMSVAIKPGTKFAPGPPIALFHTNRRQPVSAQDVFSYDVTPDGKRFLVITAVDESKGGTISVALNWASAMKN